MTRAPSLTCVRRIRATPEKVFNAFVDPRELVHWWGPDAGPTLSAKTDVRVGGTYSVVFETAKGERFESRGEYLVVEPPRRLEMTFYWSATPHLKSHVTVTVKAIDGGSELTVVHDGFDDSVVPTSHEDGWKGALDKLTERVERTNDEEEKS